MIPNHKLFDPDEFYEMSTAPVTMRNGIKLCRCWVEVRFCINRVVGMSWKTILSPCKRTVGL